MSKDKEWQCEDCNTISIESDLLTAPNPFDTDADLIVGCPKCKSTAGFEEICDELGCERGATCGYPTEGKYRRTCGTHYEREAKNED